MSVSSERGTRRTRVRFASGVVGEHREPLAEPIDLERMRLDLRGGSAAEIEECANVDQTGQLQPQIVPLPLQHGDGHAASTSSSSVSGATATSGAVACGSISSHESTAPAAAMPASA